MGSAGPNRRKPARPSTWRGRARATRELRAGAATAVVLYMKSEIPTAACGKRQVAYFSHHTSTRSIKGQLQSFGRNGPQVRILSGKGGAALATLRLRERSRKLFTRDTH
jgi:hypothetical protein